MDGVNLQLPALFCGHARCRLEGSDPFLGFSEVDRLRAPVAIPTTRHSCIDPAIRQPHPMVEDIVFGPIRTREAAKIIVGFTNDHRTRAKRIFEETRRKKECRMWPHAL